MERLTARTHDGHAYLANVKDDEQEVECRSRNTAQCIMDSWERLAAYEDTGLEPEEIKQMCALARLNSNIFDNDFGNHIAELIVAEQDGRLLVLPCKVGDTVHEALFEWDCTECLKTSFKPKVRERKVTHFMFGKSGDIIVGVAGDGADYLIYGKTVFLARAEAAEAWADAAVEDLRYSSKCWTCGYPGNCGNGRQKPRTICGNWNWRGEKEKQNND